MLNGRLMQLAHWLREALAMHILLNKLLVPSYGTAHTSLIWLVLSICAGKLDVQLLCIIQQCVCITQDVLQCKLSVVEI